jgi:hypothetical protein
LIERECIGEKKLTQAYLLPWINKTGSSLFEISYTRFINSTSRITETKLHQISYLINDGSYIKDIVKYNFLHKRKGKRVSYNLHGFYLKRMYRTFCSLSGMEDRYLSEFFIEFPQNLLVKELSEEDYRFCLLFFQDAIYNSKRNIEL